MIGNKQYRGILKHGTQELYRVENDCPNRLIANLTWKLENEFHDAKAFVINKASGDIIFQCKRAAIC